MIDSHIHPPNSLPVSSVDLSGNEKEYVLDAMESTWISSSGPYVERFERDFAARCGAKAAISVCNGTAALHLALLALDVRPGDEVLVPSLTYIATANAVRYVGAEPVFIDVDPETWCIDPLLIEDAITPRTRGVIAVHLYGHPADMDALNHTAAVHGLWVIEDAAEAHLARYKGRPVGGLGRMATFSFYGNKILTSGEGGALTLSDPNLEIRARALRGQGVDPNRRYFFPTTGYNFRLTNVACAILCGQLERSDEIIGRRSSVFDSYREMLEEHDGIEFQPRSIWAEPAPWLFNVLIVPEVFGLSRDQLAARLSEQNIDTRPFFIPLHTLPPFRREAQVRETELPHTDRLSSRGLSLPTFNTMTERDVERVCGAIAKARS